MIIGGTPGSQNSLTSLNILNEPAVVPVHFELSQNYPNPFNDQTIIQFFLPEEAPIRITVYDILGREIIILSDKILVAGTYKTRWDGRDKIGLKVPTGIYFYRFDTVAFADVKKMIYLK